MPQPDPEKTVTIAPEPAPVAPKPAAVEPDPEIIEAKVRERLKADFEVEDPEEIKGWRERAQRADQLEAALQTYQRQPPPGVPPGYGQPRPQAPQQPQFDLEQWRAYARIDPGGAFLQLRQIEAQQRQIESQQQMQAVETRIRASQEFAAAETAAERYVRDEYPEAYNKSTKLHKRGSEVYASMPWLHQMGNGFQIATQIAAADLGLLPKSKRTSAADADEVAAQAPERGTRKPAPTDRDDSGPLTPRQKKMARDMGVDEKTYKQFAKARKEGKNVRVE